MNDLIVGCLGLALESVVNSVILKILEKDRGY